MGLAARRGARVLFEGLTLDLAPGAALAVTGPNGIGKSTFLRILAGLTRPAAGTVAWDGRICEGRLPDAAPIAYLGHKAALKPDETVRESVAVWAADPGRVPGALDTVGLAAQADRRTGLLSAGQRRRVALARLAAMGTDLWLMDEPTASLDADGAGVVARLIAAHRAAGGIAIVATHDRIDMPGAAALAFAAEEGTA